MTQVVVACDEAPYQGAFAEHVLELRHTGPRSNVNLSIESPEHSLKAPVGALAADLLRVASYCYGADQAISRGGEADPHGRRWEREFLMCISVSDPDHWNELKEPLAETLH